MNTRNPYPSDVSDEEWSFVAPHLTLLPEDVSQRFYALQDVFNAARLDRASRCGYGFAICWHWW